MDSGFLFLILLHSPLMSITNLCTLIKFKPNMNSSAIGSTNNVTMLLSWHGPQHKMFFANRNCSQLIIPDLTSDVVPVSMVSRHAYDLSYPTLTVLLFFFRIVALTTFWWGLVVGSSIYLPLHASLLVFQLFLLPRFPAHLLYLLSKSSMLLGSQ